jgi:hypothetical protein
VGLENPLHAVHGPADDGERRRRDAVLLELALGEPPQRGQGIGLAVEAGARGEVP